jgi:hypothetical protein
MPDQGANHDRLGRKSWKRSWRSASPITKATLIFSAIAAIATVAYAVIAAYQLLDLREATKSATQVEVSSHMPIVYPRMEPDWVIENGKPQIRIGMTLVNRGETPAVSPVFRWGWGTKPPDDSTHYQVNPQDAWSKSIWPKGVEAFDHQYISVDEAKSLAKGPLFVYGVAQYLDVFPKSKLHPRKDHRVEFCVRVVRFTVSERNTSWGNEPSLAGSCVDDGCSDYKHDVYNPSPK